MSTSNDRICSPTGSKEIRSSDLFGAGRFGASRGQRMHIGVDLVVAPGSDVVSPIMGKVVRKSRPYANDLRFEGLLIQGLAGDCDLAVQIWYVEVSDQLIGKTVTRGQKVGTAADLGIKYPGITNHVHLNVLSRGVVVDPTQFLSIDQRDCS